MRPLSVDRSDRAIPNPPARPEPLFQFRLPRFRGGDSLLFRMPPRLLAGVAMLAVVAGAGAWLWHSGRLASAADLAYRTAIDASMTAGFKVAAVNAVGREATPSAALLEAIGLKRGDPILAFDVDAARERVEKIPMVRSAVVRRILPDTIQVEIHERKPYARWQIDERTVVVDAEGKVLTGIDAGRYADLKRVVGPGAAQNVGELFAMLEGEPELFGRVKDIVRVRERRWDIAFDNGVIVMLPEEAPAAAWRKLAGMQRDKGILSRAVVTVDLRLPEKTVVRLMHEAVPQPPAPPKKAGKNA